LAAQATSGTRVLNSDILLPVCVSMCSQRTLIGGGLKLRSSRFHCWFPANTCLERGSKIKKKTIARINRRDGKECGRKEGRR
jgi:hypothetical protein